MKKYITGLLLTLALISAPAEQIDSPGWVAAADGYVIAALKQPCPTHILKKIPPEYRGRFSLATGTFPDKQVKGCWAPISDQIVLIWEDGSYGYLPQHKFNKLLTT